MCALWPAPECAHTTLGALCLRHRPRSDPWAWARGPATTASTHRTPTVCRGWLDRPVRSRPKTRVPTPLVVRKPCKGGVGARVARARLPCGSDKSLDRGLTFNRSQRVSCSATYETLTQNQVVYK